MKQEFINLVTQGKLVQACALIKSSDDNAHVMVSARLNNLLRMEGSGTISFDNANVARANIVNSLLAIGNDSDTVFGPLLSTTESRNVIKGSVINVQGDFRMGDTIEAPMPQFHDSPRQSKPPVIIPSVTSMLVNGIDYSNPANIDTYLAKTVYGSPQEATEAIQIALKLKSYLRSKIADRAVFRRSINDLQEAIEDLEDTRPSTVLIKAVKDAIKALQPTLVKFMVPTTKVSSYELAKEEFKAAKYENIANATKSFLKEAAIEFEITKERAKTLELKTNRMAGRFIESMSKEDTKGPFYLTEYAEFCQDIIDIIEP